MVVASRFNIIEPKMENQYSTYKTQLFPSINREPNMALTEESISKQIIKPSSSPSPIASTNHKISFLDQIAPPVYLPIVFFYRNGDSEFNQLQVSESLRQSLSQILALYYPVAGKLERNSFIECDDSGVEFVEARVHGRIEQFQADPKTEELKQLVPVDSSAHTGEFLMQVKLSFLDCGGFSVGVCWSHKVGDYASFATFMNAWAATCRGADTQITQPTFDLPLHFPQKESAPVYFSEEKETIITKRLIFDKETMEKIKKQEANCSEIKNPTRVEALSTFIWKIFIAATKAKRDPHKSSFAALHAINLRPRTSPPIPDSTFGNCYIGTFAFVSDGSDVLSNLRAAIKGVDDGYIKNVINDEEYLRVLDDANMAFQRGETDLCNFSSWWRFPVYGADFGWGRPAWVCTVAQPYKNLVLFLSTPSGDGIEAWTNMPHDFAEIFEKAYDEILLSS